MTKWRARRFAVALLTFSAQLAACAARAPVLTVEPSDQAPELVSGRVYFGDAGLRRSVNVLGYSASQSASGLLQAGVKLRSRSGRTERLEWRVVWIDSAGFKLRGDDRPWSPFQIDPLAECDLQATATRPDAATFRFEVRRERPLVAE